MKQVHMLSEAELRDLVKLDLDALETVAEAFTWLAEDRVTMPPILHVAVPEHHGDVDVKTAYVRGLDRFAVKIAAGFYNNSQVGLPTGSGMMVVLSAKTGFCEAVLLDNGYLTDVRTALAGAIAARHLAPATVQVAGVLGTGAQARWQMQSLQLVRPFERLLVWGRNGEKAAAYREDMEERLGVPVHVAKTAEEVVRESQCVVTTTPAQEPLIRAEWLHPGLHITAMGSDGPGKQELDPEVLRRADHLVCDRVSQCEVAGELQHLGLGSQRDSDRVPITELGALTSGLEAGRTCDEEITVCDLTGTGVQDTAIAVFALRRAAQRTPLLLSRWLRVILQGGNTEP